MKRRERRLLGDALAFALRAHGDQVRKGTTVPYASHLLQVSGLVLQHGGDAEQAAAGLLHDVLEDCPGTTKRELRERFGKEVARLVDGCTDLLDDDEPGRKSPWRERKERYVAHLRTADARTRLVAACDKLHNLMNLVSDLRAEGPATLARFNAPPDETLWYQEAVGEALGRELPFALRRELDLHLDELRRHLGAGASGSAAEGDAAAAHGAGAGGG